MSWLPIAHRMAPVVAPALHTDGASKCGGFDRRANYRTRSARQAPNVNVVTLLVSLRIRKKLQLASSQGTVQFVLRKRC